MVDFAMCILPDELVRRKNTKEERIFLFLLDLGEFREENAQGKGTLTEVAGMSYVGEFQHWKPHGQGKYTSYAESDVYSKGDIYQGKWQDGEQHGQGRCTYATGNVYEGCWHGERHGQGKFTSVTGDAYEGGWRHGHVHGRGVHTNHGKGYAHDGLFNRGHAHGLGTRRIAIAHCPTAEGAESTAAAPMAAENPTPMPGVAVPRFGAGHEDPPVQVWPSRNPRQCLMQVGRSFLRTRLSTGSSGMLSKSARE